MKEVSVLRNQVKKYIDTADEKTLKMMYAILEAEQESDWADEISADERHSLEEALKQAERGQVTPYEEVMKRIQSPASRW